MPDKLDELFELQTKLGYKLHNGKFPTKLEDQVSSLCTAIIHEATELQRLTNWKWWKKPVDFDIAKAREELADLWHFIIDASITLGMSSQQVYLDYINKNKINFQRQKEGY